jgi:branched-chain amino acid transport system substrate-binding protein
MGAPPQPAAHSDGSPLFFDYYQSLLVRCQTVGDGRDGALFGSDVAHKQHSPEHQETASMPLQNRSTLLAAIMMAAINLCAAPASAALDAVAPIVIGQVLPLTGPLAGVGRDIEQATRAHFDYVNARGGISGHRLELITLDDGNDPKAHAVAASKLIKEKNVVALLNCFGSIGCVAGAAAAKANQTPLVGPLAGAAYLRSEEAGRVFTVRPEARLEVGYLIDFAHRSGLKRVALYVQDDGFGRGYLGAARDALKARNISNAVEVIFAPTTSDYETHAKAVMADGVDAVVMLANVTHSVELIKAVKARSGNPYFFNLAGQANGAFVKALHGQNALAAFAAFTPSPWSERVPAAIEYRDAWQKTANDKNYSFLSFEAYLNAKMLTVALERMGKGSITRTKLADSVAALRDADLGGMAVSYAAGPPDASSFMDLAVMTKTGRFVQ